MGMFAIHHSLALAVLASPASGVTQADGAELVAVGGYSLPAGNRTALKIETMHGAKHGAMPHVVPVVRPGARFTLPSLSVERGGAQLELGARGVKFDWQF